MKNYVTTVKERAEDIGARAMVGATNAVGRFMNTRAGKFAVAVPMAMSAIAIRASAEGDVSAQEFIDGIMGILGPGVIGLGSLVAVVGGIQTGVGFKDDNADGKTRGFQTLIGGAIIAAVGAIVPSSISLGG
ncbi:MAG: hypothetical protein K6C13_04615 [Oscillospiraceae bacterium]|nr:hypothetical protein [Oscillospiraceae bacterium]